MDDSRASFLRLGTLVSIITFSLTLIACSGGGGGGNNSNPQSNVERVALKGSVTGLQGTLVLQHGADTLEVSQSGEVSINASIPVGTEYEVSVKRNPIGQQCVVNDGKGTVDSSGVSISVNCSEAIYLSLLDREHGQEIWVTDGTEAGTQLFIDTLPGEAGSYPVGMVKFGEKLAYLALNTRSKLALYLTDGTPEGTQEITEVFSGDLQLGDFNALKSLVADFILEWNGRLYLQRSLQRGSAELISIDAAGSVEVVDPYSFEAEEDSLLFFSLSLGGLGERLVYQRFKGRDQASLHSFDGNQTSDLAEQVLLYAESSRPSYFGENYYFFLSPNVAGNEIWQSDGTVGNTVRVKEAPVGLNYLQGVTVGDQFYFVASTGSRGIYSIDGSAVQSRLIYGYEYNDVAVEYFLEFDEEPYFIGTVNQSELGLGWQHGMVKVSANSVDVVVETNPVDSVFALFPEVVELNSKLVFLAWEKVPAPEPDPTDPLPIPTLSSFDARIYSYDGVNPAEILEEYRLENFSQFATMGNLHTVNGKLLYFSAEAGVGAEPYVSDGTANSGRLLKDVNTATRSSYFDIVARVGSGVIAKVSNSGSLLRYSYMGITDKGNEDLGISSTYLTCFIHCYVSGEQTYFPVASVDSEGAYHYELVVTDGTAAGTRTVTFTEESTAKALNAPVKLIRHNGDLYVLVSTGFGTGNLLRLQIDESDPSLVTGNYLFESDVSSITDVLSTNDGSLAVLGVEDQQGWFVLFDSELKASRTDLTFDGQTFMQPSQLQEVNGRLYFLEYDFYTGPLGVLSYDLSSGELRHVVAGSNTIVFGQMKVFDVSDELIIFSGGILYHVGNDREVSRFAGSFPLGVEVIQIEDALYFSASDPETDLKGYELRRYLSGEVTVVKDIYEGDESSFPSDFVVLNDRLLFTATDPVYGRELWISDGSELGTVRLKDIYPGLGASNPEDLLKFDESSIFFMAKDQAHGLEVWKSDGSEGGTQLYSDVTTAGADSWVKGLVLCFYEGKVDLPYPPYNSRCYNPFQKPIFD